MKKSQKTHFHFHFPDDARAAFLATHAEGMFSAIWEYREYLRQHQKYGVPKEIKKVDSLASEHYDRFWQLFGDIINEEEMTQ
jgi:pyrroloquinoline quinone (PQQ) biosynthesis protein C